MTQQTQKTRIEPEDLKPGMVVRIHQKIKEMNAKGEVRERIQMFEGTVIARHGGNTAGSTVTVRKISAGIGVEKIFPLHSPVIASIELVKQLKTRRAKLYFLKGYKKKVKELKSHNS